MFSIISARREAYSLIAPITIVLFPGGPPVQILLAAAELEELNFGSLVLICPVTLQAGAPTVIEGLLKITLPAGVQLIGFDAMTGKQTLAVSHSEGSVIAGTLPSGMRSISKSSRSPRAEGRTLMFPLIE